MQSGATALFSEEIATLPPSNRLTVNSFTFSGFANTKPSGGSSRAIPNRKSPAVVMAGVISKKSAILRAKSFAP